MTAADRKALALLERSLRAAEGAAKHLRERKLDAVPPIADLIGRLEDLRQKRAEIDAAARELREALKPYGIAPETQHHTEMGAVLLALTRGGR